MSKYFFDSYALFEIVFGNDKYMKYAEAGGVTTIFNIAELNYGLKKERLKEEADKITDSFKQATIKVFWEDLKEAMSLKLKHKDLSIPDSIGYTTAKRLGMRFLTGDEDFRDFDNVEFIKK
ncbi:PIN domain-containing protein [Candidatus Pacearchaeota archaeon]|nr:PIN domain-containing protein [Candidatus Pacearchaeota archaeon]